MVYKAKSLPPFGLLLEPKEPSTDLSDIEISPLRKLVECEHLLVLRGFNTFQTTESFSHYCERWGQISLWPFGKVLELTEQDNPEDHIFDHSYVPLHWDGMYRPQVPELQIFHCVKAPRVAQGGRTIFSNTILALQYATKETKKLWQQVTGIYQRKMEFYHSKTVSPVINKHPYKNFSVIRYNEPHSSEQGRFVNPPDLTFIGVNNIELKNFHQSLKFALYAPSNFYAHSWQTGDIVIADNFSLLHGREKFVSKSPRHLQRVHILSDPPFNNPGLESYQ